MKLVISLLFVNIIAFGQHQKAKHYPKVSFSKVGESKADTLEFNAEVKSTYKCPPCPEGAQCKPCIGDHVVVTEGKRETDFRVFTHEPTKFKEGSTYLFRVRFRSVLHRIDNIELVTIVD